MEALAGVYAVGEVGELAGFDTDEPNLARAIAAVRGGELSALAPGRHELDGERVFANADEPTLAPPHERQVELHRRYFDLHLPLDGEETIGLGRFAAAPGDAPFDVARDIGFYRRELRFFTLRPGQFALCAPGTCAHAPACTLGAVGRRRKLIVKALAEGDGRLEFLKAVYDRYVDGYREAGRLSPMMELKRTHTLSVLKNAEAIVRGEAFDSRSRTFALAAALLHDTGRYEQLRRYNTFRDSDSVDHAVFSHDIVAERGWLDECGYGGDEQPAILKAVLWHNRRELPEEPDAATLAAAHTVRDADKLDIFRVLEDQIAHCDWRHDCRAFWNLPVAAPPNPEVLKAIRERRAVDYQHIASLADFVLIQVGWMVTGLRFATSRRLCRERGHLDFRRRFLGELGCGEAVAEVCDLAGRALEA